MTPHTATDNANLKLRLTNLARRLRITLEKTSQGLWTAIHWPTFFEISAIFLWALWVGRTYLDTNVYFWPLGSDFTLEILDHFPWEMLPRCGICMLWNGSVNGGSPAFAAIQGAVLHPVAVLSTLIWGAINGGKITIVAALFLAGLAQWWLARVMKLGFAARIWAAALAVVGGHLSGRMEIGLSTMLLSIASVSLVFAPLIDLAVNKNRRAIVWLGLALGLSILSGQGYMQLALAFGVAPAFVLTFLLNDRLKLRDGWHDYLNAVILGVLLAGVLLVPTLHFWPEFIKEGDLSLASAQPLAFMPLNLVIPSLEFFQSELLGKITAPFVYMIYIGWIPVILAALSLKLVPRQYSRLLIFFWLSILLIFVISSREVLHFLLPIFPTVTFIRYPSLMTALAVPLIIALAAWSADLILKWDWPKIELSAREKRLSGLPLSWLVVILPLLLAIRPVYDFSQSWYHLVSFPLPKAIIENLRTPYSEWVAPPYGEFPWPPEMIRQGFKITGVIRPWHWKTHTDPAPALEARRYASSPSLDAAFFTDNIEIIPYQRNTEVVNYQQNNYAAVFQEDNLLAPCNAAALGGQIDVLCNAPAAGTLIVRENNFSGWKLTVDGQPQKVDPSNPWLTAVVSPGEHVYSFRYRPWDVWLGFAFTLAGVFYAVSLWRKTKPIS